MKKIVWTLSVLFILVGCAAKPESTVTAYLEAIKVNETTVFDTQEQAKYFDRTVELEDLDDAQALLDDQSEVQKAFSLELFKVIKEFEYKVVSSTISQDKQTTIVQVEFTTYPVGDMMLAMMQKLFASLFTMTFENDEQVTQFMLDTFVALKPEYQKDRVNTVDVHLFKVENEWKMVGDEINTPMFNALLGGVMDLDVEGMME